MAHPSGRTRGDRPSVPGHVVYAFIDEPPFGAPGLGGSPVGYDFAVARAVLLRLGISRIGHRLVTFADLIPGVAEARWDINTGMFVTARRAEKVIFSSPIWALVDGFVVAAGNPKRIHSYQDAARDETIVLGVVEGNVQIETALAAGVPAARLRRFRSQDAVVREVAAGNVTAYPGAALAHRGFLERLGDNRLEVVEVASDSIIELPKGAFSFGRWNAGFAKLFERELVNFLGSAEHRELARQHGLGRGEIDPILNRRPEPGLA